MENKARFLGSLAAAGCNVSNACNAAGISRATYYGWIKNDPDFAASVGALRDALIDHVEDCLMQQIEGGNTTATTFFLKCQGRKRGWNANAAPVENVTAVIDAAETQRLKDDAKARLVDAVREAGGSPVVFSFQIEMAAALYVQAVQLMKYLAARGDVVANDRTREGLQRQHIDPHFAALMSVARRLQELLRGLGLNSDSKPVKADDDFFARLNELNDADK